MLGKADAIPNLAVKDLDRATRFYEDKLGLTTVDKMGEDFAVLESGNTKVNVYRSEFAGTNKATAVSWGVDDIDDEVKTLKEKGIMFEHYDMPGLKVQGDVHVGDNAKMAWFKDPDGNILHLVEE